MIEHIKKFFNKDIGSDLRRMGLVFIAIIVLNVIDSLIPFSHIAYMTAVLSSTSVVLFIAAASHLMRRIFFPNISVTELVQESLGHPIAASLVFLGISVILSSLIVVNVILLG